MSSDSKNKKGGHLRMLHAADDPRNRGIAAANAGYDAGLVHGDLGAPAAPALTAPDMDRRVPAPVWAMEVYLDIAKRLGHSRAKIYLSELAQRMAAVQDRIGEGAGDGATADFRRDIHDLLAVAGTFGFQEVSRLCEEIQEGSVTGTTRDQTRDLARAIRRALARLEIFLTDKYVIAG